VVIMDRTGSMDAGDVAETRTAADAVLQVYHPAIQRVALGLLGPSSSSSTCSGSGGGPAVKVNPLVSGGTPTAPTEGAEQSSANVSAGAKSLVISKPTTTSGDLLVAGITVNGGSSITVTPPTVGGTWNLIRRTDNGTNVSLLTYDKVSTGSSEPTSYTWTFSSSVQASGGILDYTGEDPTNPINTSSSNSGSGTTVTASAVTPTSNQTALVGFYGGSYTGTSSQPTFSAPGSMTQQVNVPHPNKNGPTTLAATRTWTNGNTSTGAISATASRSVNWAAQLIAINPAPVDTYGTDPASNLSQWIPIGFTGTDSDTPAHAYDEAYVDGSGNLNPASHIVSAINCYNYPSSTGTNLTTPINMAVYDLQTYGRSDVTWGILLETDGQPNLNGTGDSGNYTCASANAAATAAKNTLNRVTTGVGHPIQIFTVGFGLDGANGSSDNPNCPDSWGTTGHNSARDLLASMATQTPTPSLNNIPGGCPGQSGDFFCVLKGGSVSDLATVFSQIAYSFANGSPHLVQMCPAPYLAAVNPTSWIAGTAVTVSGSYFTGATSVTFGGHPATIQSLSDTSIGATASATGSGLGSVVVTTPCGTN